MIGSGRVNGSKAYRYLNLAAMPNMDNSVLQHPLALRVRKKGPRQQMCSGRRAGHAQHLAVFVYDCCLPSSSQRLLHS